MGRMLDEWNQMLLENPAGPRTTTSGSEKMAPTETTNDRPEDVARGAIKYDADKVPVFRGAIDYFPRAIKLVAAVSAFGASKYAWKGWEGVDDGVARYTDAMVRHLMAESTEGVADRDSGLPHAAHAAWNALARLELKLREQDDRYPERH
jgi:hypothetical protein